MKISVLIPTWRRPEELVRCLAALGAQSRAPDEVLVIAREGDDETRVTLAELPASPLPVRTVWVRRPGAVAALKEGLRRSSGDIVAITDDDAAPWPDWLERIESRYGDARVGGVGGPDRQLDRPPPPLDPATVVGRVRWFGRAEGNHHLGAGAARPVDVLKGVNMSVRAGAIEASWLDERLRGEGAQVHWELALCLALRRAGWTLLYDPAAGVDHRPAPRAGTDQRVARPLAALADEVHNQTYALLRWLPAWRKPLALGYCLLVGTRHAPGLATFLERAARVRDRRGLWLHLLVSSRARYDGLRTALSARGQEAGRESPRSTRL